MWVVWLWIKEAVKGIRRNLLMNSFAFLLAIMCFVLLASSIIVATNARHMAETQENKIEIVVHIKDEITDYRNIEEKIKGLQQVKSYSFVSKEEAYEVMKQDLGNRKGMLTDLGFNPLPASFEIKLHDAREVQRVVNTIESWGIDKSIKYGEEFLDNFFKITDRINQIAIFAIIAVAFVVGAVIFASIRMNILNRNKEIEIKNLVGAGPLNIRVPFVLEAVMLTFISATFVLILVYFFYEKGISYLASGFPLGSFIGVNEIMGRITVPMYFVALVIAFTSALLSTAKYLKRH